MKFGLTGRNTLAFQNCFIEAFNAHEVEECGTVGERALCCAFTLGDQLRPLNNFTKFIGVGLEFLSGSCEKTSSDCSLSTCGGLQGIRWSSPGRSFGRSLLATNFHEISSIWGAWLVVMSMMIIHHIMVIGDLFLGKKAWI